MSEGLQIFFSFQAFRLALGLTLHLLIGCWRLPSRQQSSRDVQLIGYVRLVLRLRMSGDKLCAAPYFCVAQCLIKHKNNFNTLACTKWRKNAGG